MISTVESASATTNTITLAVSPEGSTWTAQTNVSWLRLANGFTSGTGSTNLFYTVDANLGTTRTGTLTIAGQTFTVTQAGTNFVATSAAATLVGSGLSSPTSLATDSAGNVVIADRNSNSIKRWNVADNTVTVLINTGLSLPNSVALDSAGNIYIADSGNDAIKKWTVTNSTLSTLVSNGLNNPYGIAVDREGNVIIADSDNNAIKRWSAADSNVTTLVSSGLSRPLGVAVDIAGNVFIADTFNDVIKRWSAANSNVTSIISSGLNTPAGVAVDGAGNVYVANTFVQDIRRRSAVNGQVTTITIPSLVQPNGVAVDAAGNVYVASTGNNTIRQRPRAFVDSSARAVSPALGSTNFLAALPASLNLLPPFAPTSSQTWLTLGGTSNAFVTANFTNNFATNRSANLAVLGVNVPFTQSGPIFLLATNAISVSEAAGTNSVMLTTLPEGATWSATNSVPWLRPAVGFTNGSGSTNFVFNYDTNSGPQRIGVLTIAGQTFTMIQAAAPLPEIGVQEPAGIELTDNGATNDLGFGYVGFTNAIKTFTITNSGGAILAGVGITKSGANAADFIVSTLGVTTVGTNSSIAFTVRFVPTAIGTRQAALQIASNDSDENPFDIALSGFGVAPSNTLSSAAQSVSFTSGSSNVLLTVTPEIATWTATANAAWLQLSPANQSGTGSTNITYTFDANPGAQRVGTLTIGGKTLTVTQAALPVPEIGVEQPSGFNLTDGIATNSFSNGYVGFTNTVKTFVITNSGTTNLTGLTVTKDGANAGDFILTQPGSATLAPNSSTTFSVSFAPAALGNRTAAIHIASNDGDENPFDITLTGTGIAPSNSLSATAQFVSHLAGSSNVTLTVFPEIASWTATANAPWLQLSAANQSGTGSTNITYTFSSNTGTQRVGTLTIGGQTLTVTQAALPLQEIGIQQPAGTELTDNASTRDFGLGIVNLTNQIKTFVITNSGTTNLTGLAITKNGANPSDFIVSNPSSINLPANSSTTFTVSFAPAATGNRTASLQITSNDTDENPFDIVLTGIGVIPTFTLAASNRIVGPSAGAESITLVVTPEIASWTATANSPWLHLNATNQTGVGSRHVAFTFDANLGATRSGTLTIAGRTLSVTQAGVNYVAAGNVLTISNTDFGEVRGMHVDAVGDIYFTDSFNSRLKRWNCSFNEIITLVSNGLQIPIGLADDTTGNLVIADLGGAAIKRWTPTNGAITTLVSSGLSAVQGLAVAGNGDIYIADSNDNAVKRWSVGSNMLTTVVSGLNTPMAVAVDAIGNVYIGSWSTNKLLKWNPSDNSLTTLVSGANTLTWSVEADEGGNVYYSEFITGDVYAWRPSTGTNSLLMDLPLELPTMTVDSSGYIYASQGPQRDRIETLPRALVDPTPRFVGYAAGSDSLPVVLPTTANLRGPFAPTSNQPWLTIGGATNGVISFSFAANTSSSNRVASIDVLGQDVSVTQSAAPFDSSLGTTNIIVGSSSGTDSIVLLLQPVTGSNWTAAANAPWLQLSAANQGGNSSTNVIFTFSANTGATRTGTLTIAGQTLFVTQASVNHQSGGALTTLVSSGLNLARGLATDTDGNIYFADTGNNAVKRWTRTNNSVSTVVASGLSQPSGVAVDTLGNVFIADTQNFAVKKWTAANGLVTTVWSSGLNQPRGIALDSAGNLFIADTANNAIKKWIATNNTVVTIISSGLNQPNGVTIDAAGNLYIADTANNSIKKWNAANNSITTLISSGIKQPNSISVDVSGNIYFTDTQNNAIKMWSVTTASVSNIASGLNAPRGVWVDETGSIYFSDTGNNQIKILPRVFVDTTPRTINTPASTNSFIAALPDRVNLLPPFAPVSSQPWFTILGASNNAILYSVTANTGAARLANITVHTRTIPITQSLIVTPTSLNYSKIGTGLVLNFAANPGQLYQIESAPAVTGPWTTNTILTAGASGFLSYTNPISTNGNRFFRTRTP